MDLGFENIAKSAFGFLESKYRFSCVELGPWCVRYESPKVFVLVMFDGTRSYELGCSIGRMDDFEGSRQVPFELGEVMRAEGISNENMSFQVTTSDALRTFTCRLAEQLERCAHRVLTGDDSVFKSVSDLRNRECAKYATEKRLEQTKTAAESAWQSKEYRKVVELLSPVQEWLNPSEVKKLEYARKRVR